MKHLIVTSAFALTSIAAPIAAHADPYERGVPYAQPVYQPAYVQPVFRQPAFVPPVYATPVHVRRFDRDGDEFRGREGWRQRQFEHRDFDRDGDEFRGRGDVRQRQFEHRDFDRGDRGGFHEGRGGRAWGGERGGWRR